jgi:transposase
VSWAGLGHRPGEGRAPAGPQLPQRARRRPQQCSQRCRRLNLSPAAARTGTRLIGRGPHWPREDHNLCRRIVMDNLKPHKVAGVREAIQAAGATLRYLPPHSPDLTPIKRLFATARRCTRPPSDPSRRSGSASDCASTPAAPEMRRLFPPRRLRCKMTGTRSGRSLLKSNRLRVPAMGYR